MTRTFKDQDDDYLAWCEDHPDGFVVNTTRTCSPSYMKLHRATCRTINQLFGRGTQLTGDYIKVCATDLTELDRWASRHGGALDRCGLCLR